MHSAILLFTSLSIALAATLACSTIANLLITLIIVFIHLFVFFLYINAEFIGVSFLIIYVGAVAILFVFALMTINTKSRFSRFYIDFSTVIFSLSLWTLFYGIVTHLIKKYNNNNLFFYVARDIWLTGDYYTFETLNQTADVTLFANLLYTKYQWLFWCNGLILLTAVVGVLTMSMPSQLLKKI